MIREKFLKRVIKTNPNLIDEFFTYFEYTYEFNFDEHTNRPYLSLLLNLKETDHNLISYYIDSIGNESFNCDFCNTEYDSNFFKSINKKRESSANDCIHIEYLISKFYEHHKDEINLKFQEFEDYENNRVKIIDQKEFDTDINELFKEKRLLNQLDNSNKIGLEIHFLNMFDGDFVVTLYIGNEKKYKIQDTRKFLSYVLNHEYHKYGKDLAFLHTFDAFDDYSKSLIAHFLNDVAINELSYRSARVSSEIDKLMELSNKILNVDVKIIPLDLSDYDNVELKIVDRILNCKI